MNERNEKNIYVKEKKMNKKIITINNKINKKKTK